MRINKFNNFKLNEDNNESDYCNLDQVTKTYVIKLDGEEYEAQVKTMGELDNNITLYHATNRDITDEEYDKVINYLSTCLNPED